MGQQKIFFTTHMWSIGLSVSAIHYVFFFPFSNAYCLLCVFQVCTHNLKFARLPDPYRGEDVTRLTKNGRILLPPNEINPCIEFFYKLSLGDGAAKLVKRINEHYFGISKNHVISFLNAHPFHSKANPSFKNKAPLQPIKAQQIMERHQIDLVSLEKYPVNLDGHQYSFVLSIIDCFSRFLWLRPLGNKGSQTVAEKLEEVYLEFGPPKILQSDRGTEFQGAVRDLAARLNIRMIHSRPYYPQSQGKVERSHSTWKQKLSKHEELLQSLESEQNWVVMLPYVAHNYNTAVHRSIGKSPYEVIFSIKSNKMIQCSNGGQYSEAECEQIPQADQETSFKEREACSEQIRSEVRSTARSADEEMVKQKLAKYPPTEYKRGQIVLLKADAVSKRGKLSVSNSKAHWAVVQDHKHFLYTVILLTGPAGRKVKVKVDKITSITRAAEMGTLPKANTGSDKKYGNIEKLLKLMVFQTSPRSGIEALQRNALVQNLQLDSDNAGGGNCLFLAIAQQLEKVFGMVKSHKEIRKEIVKFLSKNPTLGTVQFPAFVSGHSSWQAYLHAMSQDGIWGDHLTLIAAANLYHMSIGIVSSVADAEPVIIDPETGTSQGTILLGHIAELHYVTLQPIETETPPLQINVDSPESMSGHIHSKKRNQTAHMESRSGCTCEPASAAEVSSLESLCDHLLIYISALATMYCEQTTANISLACKRFNDLVKSQ